MFGHIRFEAIMVVQIYVSIFYVMTLCGLLDGY
jgi:hypothetical protein